MISVITPVFNEENTLDELFKRVETSFKELNQDFEIIFIDNGSSDNSLNIIKKISRNKNNIKFLSLKKNVGHQGALWAGLTYTNNTTVMIDADLQQPPELIKEFIKKWRSGFKIVNTKKKLDHDNRKWKKIASLLFYKIINKLTNLNLSSGQSDFCLLDSEVLKEIKKFEKKKSFLRGIVNFTNFKKCIVEYEVQRRKFGESKFSKIEYFHLAIDGISNYSKVSIIFVFWILLIINFLCFVYLIYLLLFYLDYVRQQLSIHWLAISFYIIILGIINILSFYMIGRYISHVWKKDGKTEYFIREKNF